MGLLINTLNLLFWISFLLIIILTGFIVISAFLSKKIVKHQMEKIGEKRKEVMKIALQDLSLYIQILISLGVAFLLYSLSLKDIIKLSWGLIGLAFLSVGMYLLYWRYTPLKNNLFNLYSKKSNKKDEVF